MRMRTYLLALVQLVGLSFIGCAYAQSDEYGANDEVTHGTVLAMPHAQTRAQTHAQPPPADMSEPVPAPSSHAATRVPRTPPRGMTKAHVLADYGLPLTRHAPVGHPPIARWDYPRYRLYFEHEHVLHAVIPDAPAAIAHADELAGSRP